MAKRKSVGEPDPVERIKKPRTGVASPQQKCPFLDTVNRKVLDFDFEHRCSTTLSFNNVYSCLVCGVFFQGKSNGSPAYSHSVQTGHAVYMELKTAKVYCLPDNYPVDDPALQDVVGALLPRLSAREIENVPKSRTRIVDTHGKTFLPGYVGLNNLKCTDYVNAMVQVLARVEPLRRYFLDASIFDDQTPVLVDAFGKLLRRMFNPRNLKSTVDPHKFVQAVSTCSKKRFEIGKLGSVIDLFTWFLGLMNRRLTKNMKSKVIKKHFQGTVQVTDLAENLGADGLQGSSVKEVPFFYLTVDLPKTTGLFSDGRKGVLGQFLLEDLLKKFDGETVSVVASKQSVAKKKYAITKSPPYLLLHVQRFTKNNFFVEKNNSIVKFPIAGLHFHNSEYDLLASVVHTLPDGVKIGEDPSGGHDIGSYKVHVQHEGDDKTFWMEIEDLRVTKIMPQLVSLAETSILLYKKRHE
jgi:U4/U6.U5 tri-snRNP-associated protein 2